MRNRVIRGGRQALLRALLRPSCSREFERLGSAYGGWWVPSDVVGPGRIAYCAGAGEDITFDLELHARGMAVHCFDPTPRAVVHVAEHAPHDDRFTFHQVGFWSGKDTLRFFAPKDPSHVSHSVTNMQGTSTYFEAAVDSVSGLAQMLGHDRVDLIKMDIEGAEQVVLVSLLQEGPMPRVLCVEFDQPQTLRAVVGAVRRLKAAHMHLCKLEGWNYTFCRQ